jgi:putative endonuclease
MEHCAWVYIIANQYLTTFYVGATTRLFVRLYEHFTKQRKNSFSSKYNLNRLVHYEGFNTPAEAFAREKFIKGKSRSWKLNLIRTNNPSMNDLSKEWFSEGVH